jgi:tellurite resistance protein TerC
MTETPLIFWVAFNVVVLCLLAVDLFVFHRHAHAVTSREAAVWTSVWVTLSLLFNAFVWQWKGPQVGIEFLTGYLVEYALSVDNIFVFVLVFAYFKVPGKYQHRVLFWGIIGALVMRGLMIWLGVTLVESFHWMLYLFGAFLIFTGIRMAVQKDDHVDPEHNPLVGLCRRLFPITPRYEGARFAVKRDGRILLTPLAIVLVMVESTDLLFALDSIPAIIAITEDPFIIYTSNVCAILGLRSLYFLLASVVHKFVYLKYGLAAILTFIGLKMVTADFVEAYFGGPIPTVFSLGFIALCLVASVCGSIWFGPRDDVEGGSGE